MMNKIKPYLPFFLGATLVFAAAEIAHYIFWGKFFFYLINSLIMIVFITYWTFGREESGRFHSDKKLRDYRFAIGLIMLFWYFCKCAKDRFLLESDGLLRFSWYTYYVAIIFLPLLCYEYSLQFDGSLSKRSPVCRWLPRLLGLLLLIAVLTNDFHQTVFGFPAGIGNWNETYTHGILYFAILIYGLLLLIFSLVHIFKQCTLPKSKKYIWLPTLPLMIGLIYIAAYLLDFDLRINDIRFFAFVDVFCYLFIMYIEACETVYALATELPDAEGLLLHRIESEIHTKLKKTEALLTRSETADEAEYKKALFYSGFIQTYSKRVANLLLLEAQQGKSDFAELSLSLAESVEFLKLNNVSAMLVTEGKGVYPLYEVLAIYRNFEERLEPLLPQLDAVLVVVSAEKRRLNLRIVAEDKEGNLL